MTTSHPLAIFAAAFALLVASARAADSPIYELRIYTTHEGKLPDLLKRFRDHTCKLFEKHGIENVAYWVPIEKADGADNKLVYLVRHKSRDAAKASWTAFGRDPDWRAAAKSSEADGKIVAKIESIYLAPTAFSPEWKIAAGNGPRVFEMRTYRTPEGKLADLHARFRDHTMSLFAKQGMTNLVYLAPTDAEKGAADTLIYFLAHPSKEAGLKAFAEFRKDPAWASAKAASEKNGPLTRSVTSLYMTATDFSPLR